MAEGANLEVSNSLLERKGEAGISRATGRERRIEIVEAIVLAVVTLTTAWSGYQSDRWSGLQDERYAEASALDIEAAEVLAESEERHLADVVSFLAWLQAHDSGREREARLLERHFSPEFHTAFEAWVATDPFSRDGAPPGPSFMAQYEDPDRTRGQALQREALGRRQEGLEEAGVKIGLEYIKFEPL